MSLNNQVNDANQVNTITPNQLQAWCDEYLKVGEFKDYAPNGLQVDGGQPIKHIVTGVTACEALIDAAIEQNAEAILVHHGYFWKGEPPQLVSMKGRRVRKLMQHGISLLAYHLPLDAHPEVGNNAILAQQLSLTVTGALYPNESNPIGNIATCAPITANDLIVKITDALNRPPLFIAGYSLAQNIGVTTNNFSELNGKLIKKIALCTGGAQDMIDQAASMGCDAYISGEISERTTHSARELGIDYFACGHHATERGGIKALGELIADKLSVSVQFIDIPNPA